MAGVQGGGRACPAACLCIGDRGAASGQSTTLFTSPLGLTLLCFFAEVVEAQRCAVRVFLRRTKLMVCGAVASGVQCAILLRGAWGDPTLSYGHMAHVLFPPTHPGRFWCDSLGFNARWDADGTLQLSWTSSPFRRDPLSGQELWFNNVVGGWVGGWKAGAYEVHKFTRAVFIWKRYSSMTM